MVHAWITSVDVVITRVHIFMGNTQRLSTSSKRNSFISNDSVGIMNESNSISLNSGYSYLQYHWWPMVLRVILGGKVVSIMYRIFRDGRAIVTRIIIGAIVQIISIVFPCRRNRLVIMLVVVDMIVSRTRAVMVVIKVIARS